MSSPICHHQSSDLVCEVGEVLENQSVAERTFRLRLRAPGIVPLVRAGQFVMLRLPDSRDPILGRPLAVYRTFEDGSLEVVYLVVGKMTTKLTRIRAGEPLEIWGPLGNGFDVSGVERLIMVAGGIGQTPFFMLAERFQAEHGPNSTALLFGARTRSRFSCVEDFERANIPVFLATDDGSLGHHDLVTELIPQVYERFQSESDKKVSVKVLCCGPHPMLQSAFTQARKLHLPCDVSLESPMACGLGICFSCVVEVKDSPDSEHWEYQRTCFDGPVFDAYRLRGFE